MADDHPYAPFGRGTIEGVFVNDIEYAFESDIGSVSVEVKRCDPKEIGVCDLELERDQVGTEVVDGVSHPIMDIGYKLTVPVELPVRSGDDVIVYGFESTWTFEDVQVVSSSPNATTVITDYIQRAVEEAQGDGVPIDEQSETTEDN